jgi:hypothetical protein
MSNFGNLKTQVKRYFSANTSLYQTVQGQPEDAEELEAEIDAAILNAANNARRYAELRHDFSELDVVGRVTVTGGGPVNLRAVPLIEPYGVDDEEASFKSVRAVHLVDTATNSLIPIRVTTRQAETIATIKRMDLGNRVRYAPMEMDFSERADYLAIIHGQYLTLQPIGTDSVTIAIDGNRWAVDYDDDEDTDYFLTRGFEFMQWQCIVELNHMLLKFVPRQEGSLAPPTQARDMAFENLLVADSYSVNGSIWHDL